MNKFKVAVVIPVYNAAPFVQKAVESVLAQPEVAEVLLVEDKSPDDSLDICVNLEKAHPRVRVFRHPNGENRGAAASRNLGVRMASAEYVAFLDADDYYLPDRFKLAAEILIQNPHIDGVYDAIGLHIYSNNGLERYQTYKGRKMDPAQLITIKKPIAPELLFESILEENIGIFHANGITVRRDFVMKVGLFDEDLDIVEDTVLWLKLAYHGKLAPGTLTEPVARQGIHDLNREPDIKPHLLYKKYNRLLSYFIYKPVNKRILRTLFVRMVSYHPFRRNYNRSNKFKKFQLFAFAALELIQHPKWIMRLA